MKRIILAFVFALLPGVPVFCQPAFDAVAIKPSAPDARGGGYNMSPGRLNAKNQTLKDLVAFAYDLHNYQLSGASGWMDSQRFEVVATSSGTTTKGQRSQMMQTMLADRFALKVHREPMDISGYSLVIGKNGPKLQAPDATQHEGMMLGRNASGQRTLTANGATMAGLASILADLLGRPVVDITALTGSFDFNMAWVPDPMGENIQKPGVEKQSVSTDDQAGPSLFTALQETLGLKLETRKVPVEGIVIDHAEKPTAN